MRKAFTLIELLVVMAVLGILAGLILPKLGGIIDSAREGTCRSNLRNLHAATISFANDNDGGLPRASWYTWLNEEGEIEFVNAWIGPLYSQNDNIDRRGNRDSAYDPNRFDNPKQVGKAIEFGHIFPYTGAATADTTRYPNETYHIGGNKKVYWCPCARAALGGNAPKNIAVTYVMNEAFGWARDGTVGRSLDNLKKYKFDGYALDSSRVMLFAEIAKEMTDLLKPPPTSTTGLYPEFVKGNNVIGDRHGKMFVLYPQGENSTAKTAPRDSFGAYHAGRGKDKEGLVVFLDGHIEKHPPFYGTTNVAWRLCRGLSADGL